MKWFACELHNHTLHSDGQFTVEGLCEAAKSRALELIALTDHNTMSGLRELTPELQARTVPVIHGIEWTAFYGHMVVLDCKKYVDWRTADLTNIDEKIAEVKANDGLVGIAHPFALGNPMCTGCYWDYPVKKWENVDYLEVWSEDFPGIMPRNPRAMRLWNDLLDAGHHVAACYGRDWHALEEEQVPFGCTYLAADAEKITPELAKDAIRRGHTMVTMGPRPKIEITVDGGHILPGDTIKAGKTLSLRIGVDMKARRFVWEKFGLKIDTIRIVGRGAKNLCEFELENDDSEIRTDLPAKEGWLRVEYWGEAMKQRSMIAYTNAVHIED